jgi:hypothetical protein
MADEKKILLNRGVIAYYTGRRFEGERQYKTACGCCCFELAIQASKRGCGIGDAFSALYVQPNESGTPSMTRYKTLTQTATCGSVEEPRTCSGVWTHEEATDNQDNGCRLTFFRSVQTVSAEPPSYANDGGFSCEDPENIYASCGADWEFTADNLSEEINYSIAEQWALSNFFATASSGDFYTSEFAASISTSGLYSSFGPRAAIEGSTHYRIRYKPSPTGYLKVWLGRRRRIIKYDQNGNNPEYQTEIDIDSVVLQHKPIKPCNGEYLYSKIFSTGNLILVGGILKPQHFLYSKEQNIYIIAYSFVEGYNPTKNWKPTDQYNLERNGFPDPKYGPTLNPF